MTDVSPDLFSYPKHAGFKTDGPSKDAARKIDGKAQTLKQRVLAAFRDGPPQTADEIAARLGVSVLSARPRCAELVAIGLIEDAGYRRKNDSGMSATVWRAVPLQEVFDRYTSS